MNTDTQAGKDVEDVMSNVRTEEQIEARSPVVFMTGVGDVRNPVNIHPLERWASRLWKTRATVVLDTLFKYLSGSASSESEEREDVIQEKVSPSGSPMLGLNWDMIHEAVNWVLMESGDELADLAGFWIHLQAVPYGSNLTQLTADHVSHGSALERATDEQVAAIFVQCVRFAFPFGQLAGTVSAAMNGLKK